MLLEKYITLWPFVFLKTTTTVSLSFFFFLLKKKVHQHFKQIDKLCFPLKKLER